MSIRRKQALAVFHAQAVPLARQVVADEFAKMQDVSLLDITVREPDKHRSDFYESTHKTDPMYRHWYVTAYLDLALTVHGAEATTSLLLYAVIDPNGELLPEHTVKHLISDIDDARRIGFAQFEFNYSLHADEIPEGLTVEISDFDYESEFFDVTLRETAGAQSIISVTRFSLANKVTYGRQIRLVKDNGLHHVTTFVALCVSEAIAAHTGGDRMRMDNGMVSDAEIDHWNQDAAIMIADFKKHSDIVRNQRVTLIGATA
jgi:hypothetical protein